MAFDLMGTNSNAYEALSGLDEEALQHLLVRKKLANTSRNLYQKIKYVSYMCGDMDAAAKHYDLQDELNANCSEVQASTGEFDYGYWRLNLTAADFLLISFQTRCLWFPNKLQADLYFSSYQHSLMASLVFTSHGNIEMMK